MKAYEKTMGFAVTFPGITLVTIATIATVVRMAYVMGIIRGLGL